MTHRRRGRVVAALGGLLVAGLCVSGPSAATARPPAHHGVVVDATNYESIQQLLTDTKVMVVAKAASVGIDVSAPKSQPASLVTLRVTHVVRGHVGKQVVVWQPRGSKALLGQAAQPALRTGNTYLLLLAPIKKTSYFDMVGGGVGGFSYDTGTKRFTALDPAATWEPSDFTLSLAEAGAGIYQAGGPPQPSWLTSPSGASGSPTVTWATMTDDLGLSPDDVSCPAADLCVFAGGLTPSRPGVEVPAVAVSTGPFTAHGNLVGTTTSFPQNADYSGQSYVSCASRTLCVLASIDGIYATSDPTSAHWTLEVPPSSDHGWGQVSCPTASFCAVAAGSGVLVSDAPLGGATGWEFVQLGSLGLGSIACPTAKLCVAGGSGDRTIGGWIEASSDPLAASSWHGGMTTIPPYAQHSGQYSVGGISCPTTAFCIAAVEAGNPLVSTNPAGGIRTWTQANGSSNPGFAQCASSGRCSVSGVGTFETTGGAGGPGIAGYPLPGVSCVSTAFCVTTTDNELAVGQAAQ